MSFCSTSFFLSVHFFLQRLFQFCSSWVRLSWEHGWVPAGSNQVRQSIKNQSIKMCCSPNIGPYRNVTGRPFAKRGTPTKKCFPAQFCFIAIAASDRWIECGISTHVLGQGGECGRLTIHISTDTVVAEQNVLYVGDVRA